jgi:hypothetical protein
MSAQLLEALAEAPPVRAAGPGARVVVFQRGTVVVVPPAEAARAGSAADPLAAPPPFAWLAPGGARAAAARRARAAAAREAQAAGDPFVRRAFDLLLAGGGPAPGTPEARPEVAPLGEGGGGGAGEAPGGRAGAAAAPRAWAASFPRLRHSALVFNLAVAAAPAAAAAAAARARAQDALDPRARFVVAGGVASRLAP